MLVILDSDHSRDHVLDELRTLRRRGCRPARYLIVEDTNVNGHPVFPEHGPGPMEALEEFLAETEDFEIDPAREKFFLTFNPRGFLRKRSVRLFAPPGAKPSRGGRPARDAMSLVGGTTTSSSRAASGPATGARPRMTRVERWELFEPYLPDDLRARASSTSAATPGSSASA